jgi:hypothetical protein
MAFAGENSPVSPFFKGEGYKDGKQRKKISSPHLKKSAFRFPSLEKHALSRVEDFK